MLNSMAYVRGNKATMMNGQQMAAQVGAKKIFYHTI